MNQKKEKKRKMKIKLFRVILLILLIGTMFTIFKFSSQNGTQSKGVSTKVSEFVLQFSNKYQQAESKEKTKILLRTNAVMRKVAHFLIYTLLGLLLMGIMSKTRLKDKWRILITIFLGLLYAISDEIHQIYSPGRTPKIADVYIDLLGIFVGILLVILIRKIYNNCITKRLQNVTKNVT